MNKKITILAAALLSFVFINAQNLLTNPGFETEINNTDGKGWDQTPEMIAEIATVNDPEADGSTLGTTTDQFLTGAQSLHLMAVRAKLNVELYQAVTVEAGSTYSFKCDYYNTWKTSKGLLIFRGVTRTGETVELGDWMDVTIEGVEDTVIAGDLKNTTENKIWHERKGSIVIPDSITEVAVCLRMAKGQAQYLDIYVDNVSVEKVETTAISNRNEAENACCLYPNPVRNILEIGQTEVRAIYNMSGQKQSLTTLDGCVDLSHLSAGIYSVQCVLANGTSNCQAIVKQ